MMSRQRLLPMDGSSKAWRRRSMRGVSLVEALMAMAVMAFGMLSVVGVQTTLRMNADVAKQRSEANRIAEEDIEKLRVFTEAAAVPEYPAATLWTGIASLPAATPTLTHANTVYTVNRSVTAQANSAQKVVSVEVTWPDRFGVTQSVVLRSVIARAAPALSGLLLLKPSRAAPTSRAGRHPTIPVRAADRGNGESVFKPLEGGTVAWTFSNTTGVISQVCTGQATTSTSASLAVGALSGCSATSAQLLSGNVRFNLSGASKDLGNGRSVIKPIAGGSVAWVIDNALQHVVRNCPVSAAATTASLTAAVVTPACALVDQSIGPFDALNDPSRVLQAIDSDAPAWPALPLGVDLTLSSSGHSGAPLCFSSAPLDSIAANSQVAVEYFCIVYPNAAINWSGRSTLAPLGYSDAGAATWSPGIVTDSYRVCRYTPSATTTISADHPNYYASVAGNLINQNFLVIAGPKSCPTDVAADPAAGDFVNTNTQQHQP